MPTVQPVFLPAAVVEENRIVLDNDFVVSPTSFCFGPDGRLHVLSTFFYNYRRYDENDDRDFSTALVNVYGVDMAPERIVDFSSLYASAGSGDQSRSDLAHPSLCVTPENRVVLSTQANRTFFFDSTLATPIGAFAAATPDDVQQSREAGFASQIEPTSDGRFVCILGEPGVFSYYSFARNLICISERGTLAPGQRPNLTCFACVDSTPIGSASFPYVRALGPAPMVSNIRPSPPLPQRVDAGGSLYQPWIEQALPLDSERCVVSMFRSAKRRLARGLPFVFAIVGYDGRVLGRLEDIEPFQDSPYVGEHFRVAVDRKHRRIVYKTKSSFFLFDFDGRRIAQVILDRPAVKALVALQLGTVGPDGQFVLYDPKHHRIVTLDPVADVAHLESALADAACCMVPSRRRLRAELRNAGERWIHPGPVIRH